MTENRVTYDYTDRDLRLNGAGNNDLREINNPPRTDGEESENYVGEISRIVMTPKEFLNEKGKIKRKKSRYELDGQITISEIEEIKQKEKIVKENYRVNLSEDDQPIKLTPSGEFMYKSDDAGEEQGHKEKSKRQIKKEEKIKEEMNLREKQFMRYEEIRDEMKKRGDKRHIFLIPRGILVENYRKNDKYERDEFFKGNLSQDVLAVKEDNYTRLIPFVLDNGIIINYFSARFGERFRDPIKDKRYRARNEVAKKFDLTDRGISSGQQLYDLLKKT